MIGAVTNDIGSDPLLLITQLGVGGVLVYFASWAYRKIEEARDKLGEQNREDIAALTARYERTEAELRRDLDDTRERLISALLNTPPNNRQDKTE
jgi:uncharacterized membrane protein YccC